jgi:hypothetical protein
VQPCSFLYDLCCSVACDHIGEEFSEASGALYREDAQKSTSYVAQTSSGKQLLSLSIPARSTPSTSLTPTIADGFGDDSETKSPLASGALSRSTLPSVQNLLKHLNSPKVKPAPSYRKRVPQGDESVFVLPEIRPKSSGRDQPTPVTPVKAVGLSGFLLDPVFSSSNTCVVPKGEPLLPSNTSRRSGLHHVTESAVPSKSPKVVVMPASRRK